jgi:hypothetical protein
VINVCLENADFDSLRNALRSVEGIVGMERVGGGDGVLEVKLICQSSADLRAEIYQKIKETDWVLVELRREVKSLENIFRELTKEN